MRKAHFTLLLLVVLLSGVLIHPLQAQTRKEIAIPDIPGYITLKCDFHMHSVFSDGTVWPTVRVDEAWAEGLDAISITDHLEYQPHKKDLPTQHNRPYELAKGRAASLGIILIRGTEITRSMPPGHFNAIFIKDAETIDTPDFMDAVEEANRQGAFVMWNHPGWTGQQKDGIAKWYDEHTAVYTKGWLHGIEVVNSREYYPEVHQWCNEKHLTLLGDSDMHGPASMSYDFSAGMHRPMTLVFARSRTADDIKAALFAGRTAVLFKDQLIGAAEYLSAICTQSITFNRTDFVLKGKTSRNLWLTNNSDLEFRFKSANSDKRLKGPGSIILPPRSTKLFKVSVTREDMEGTYQITLPYTVTNAVTGRDTYLEVSFPFTVMFTSK